VRRRKVLLALFDVNYVTSALKYVQALARGLDRSRFDPLVGAFLPTTVKELSGVPVHSLGSLPRAAFTSAPKLARLVRDTGADIVVSNNTGPNLAACLSRLLGAKARTVIVEHNTFSVHEGAKPFKRAAARFLYPRADRVVCVSHGVARDLQSLFPALGPRIRVVHNPVLTPPAELAEMAGQPPPHPWLSDKTAPVVLNVGEVYPRKGQETLIRALPLLRERINARLLIAGTTVEPETSRLKNLAASLGVADHAAFAGYVDNPFSAMSRADAFALSSKEEGFGLVLVEAMACGCPVVSTDCPYGPSEIIEHERSGLLVPVGDHRAMAEALARILTDPGLAGSLRREGLKRVQHFSLPRFLDAFQDVLEEALSGGNA
jgi:glycosyltransferase involved in cell wall biosynthesis